MRNVVITIVIVGLIIVGVFYVPFYCVETFERVGGPMSQSVKVTRCSTVWEYVQMKGYVK